MGRTLKNKEEAYRTFTVQTQLVREVKHPINSKRNQQLLIRLKNIKWNKKEFNSINSTNRFSKCIQINGSQDMQIPLKRVILGDFNNISFENSYKRDDRVLKMWKNYFQILYSTSKSRFPWIPMNFLWIASRCTKGL